MEFPNNYTVGLEQTRSKDFPKLIEGKNFHYTSLRTDLIEFASNNYNCCAWAIGRTDSHLEMASGFLEELDLDWNNLDHTVDGYAKDVYSTYGFESCADGSLEKGYEKIVLYEDSNGLFTHVARQLSNGTWTSKMGDWEDISHETVNDLVGDIYGKPKIYMKRHLAN